MKKKSIQAVGLNGSIMAVIWGALVAIVLTALGAMISASIVNSGSIGEKGVAFVAMIIWLISSLCGSIVAGKLAKNNILPVIFISAAVYVLILIGLKIILFDAPFAGIGKGMLIILVGVVPSLLLSGKQKHGKKMKFKYNPK